MENQGRLGAYLRELRTTRNLSLRAAAEGIGITTSRLGELENNRSRVTRKSTSPGLDVIMKIARYYELPLGRLLEMAGLSSESAPEPIEAELLIRFRRLSPKNREILMALARILEQQDQPSASETST